MTKKKQKREHRGMESVAYDRYEKLMHKQREATQFDIFTKLMGSYAVDAVLTLFIGSVGPDNVAKHFEGWELAQKHLWKEEGIQVDSPEYKLHAAALGDVKATIEGVLHFHRKMIASSVTNRAAKKEKAKIDSKLREVKGKK